MTTGTEIAESHRDQVYFGRKNRDSDKDEQKDQSNRRVIKNKTKKNKQ